MVPMSMISMYEIHTMAEGKSVAILFIGLAFLVGKYSYSTLGNRTVYLSVLSASRTMKI